MSGDSERMGQVLAAAFGRVDTPGAPYVHTYAPDEERVEYLNFAAELTSAVVGDLMGPDTSGRYWRIADVGPRVDGQPGTRVKVWRLPPKQLTLTDGAA